MQRLLGLDFGDKRVGLALAESRGPALPYKVLANKGFDDLLARLKIIIQEENIDILVVGLPLSLSGRTNERLLKTKEFIDCLRANLQKPVYTYDERMTSKLYTRQGISAEVDKYAAAAILESYLASHGS